VDRQTHTERQTDTIITILRAPYRGGGVINKSNFVKNELRFAIPYRRRPIRLCIVTCAMLTLCKKPIDVKKLHCRESLLRIDGTTCGFPPPT